LRTTNKKEEVGESLEKGWRKFGEGLEKVWRRMNLDFFSRSRDCWGWSYFLYGSLTSPRLLGKKILEHLREQGESLCAAGTLSVKMCLVVNDSE
jgi:hypothetical protein